MKYNTMISLNVLLVHWMQGIHIQQDIQSESVTWSCGFVMFEIKEKRNPEDSYCSTFT